MNETDVIGYGKSNETSAVDPIMEELGRQNWEAVESLMRMTPEERDGLQCTVTPTSYDQEKARILCDNV